jgi:hypothetical protein
VGSIRVIRIGLVIVASAFVQTPAVYAQSADAPSDSSGEKLRAVEVVTAPAEVERIVRFRALGFGQDDPFGGSLEVAALIDGNINRATRTDAMGTGISDFVPEGFVPLPSIPGSGGSTVLPGIPVSPIPGGIPGVGAGAISDFGMSVRGQAYLRRQADNDSDFLLRVSGSGEIYGDSRFDDIGLSVEAGPEYLIGRDRLAVFAGPTWRWYGTDLYSRAIGAGVSWQHPLGHSTQLRLEFDAAHVDNRRDDLLDGDSFSLTAELDRVLSGGSGYGAQFTAVRETARDPGYAITRAGLDLHGFHTFGATTLIGTVGYSRLEADRSLSFLLDRRADDRFTASLAATFGSVRLGPVAPLLRLSWERNRSTLSYYDFDRVAGEIGLVAPF